MVAIVIAIPGCASSGPAPDRSSVSGGAAEIDRTLDALHNAAATADEDTYFALFAPDAVFLGTDATERWPLPAFKAFAMPYFQRDSAWVYETIERHIDVAPGGDFAWFDERLMNARLGETRGSGALRRIDGAWRIVQYNLTIPVPNNLADEFAERIREYEAAQVR